MSNRPFVGVCGIQTPFELDELQRLAPTVLAGTDRYLMAAIKQLDNMALASWDSLLVRPFVHCDFSEQEPFEQLVEQRLAATQHFVQGLQLNVLPWMETDYAPLWTTLKQQHPTVSLMLQAHQHILEYSPQDIADRLRGLAIDYILFDASQSRGLAYDPVHVYAYIEAVQQVRPDIGVVVAGGLCGPTMQQLFAPLVQAHPTLSCDGFGRLQDPSTQTLSWPKVEAYLAAWRACLPATSM